jgi:hypothetical protein
MPAPLRHSALKRMGEAPAKFLANEEKTGQEFEKGTGAHSVLLGGKRLVIWDKKSDKGNQCPRRGADFDAFAALNADSLILLPGEHEQIQGMAESVLANADAVALLAGRKEKTLYWTIDGRECRGTPDVDNGHAIVELKTTKSSDPRYFWRDSWKFNYHGALAWYMDGCAQQFGRRMIPDEAYIVAVESAKPYIVTVFRVPQHALEAGRRQNRAWFERLRECERSGVWPGYATGIVDLEFPEKERQAWNVSAEEAA